MTTRTPVRRISSDPQTQHDYEVFTAGWDSGIDYVIDMLEHAPRLDDDRTIDVVTFFETLKEQQK